MLYFSSENSFRYLRSFLLTFSVSFLLENNFWYCAGFLFFSFINRNSTNFKYHYFFSLIHTIKILLSRKCFALIFKEFIRFRVSWIWFYYFWKNVCLCARFVVRMCAIQILCLLHLKSKCMEYNRTWHKLVLC